MAAELSLRAPTEPETVPKPRVCLRRRQVNPKHVFLLFLSYSSPPRSACGMYVWGWWWYMCVGLHAKARCSHRVYFSISHLMYKGRGFQLNPEFGQGVTLPCLCPRACWDYTQAATRPSVEMGVGIPSSFFTFVWQTFLAEPSPHPPLASLDVFYYTTNGSIHSPCVRFSETKRTNSEIFSFQPNLLLTF